jgi:hypothetical protein
MEPRVGQKMELIFNTQSHVRRSTLTRHGEGRQRSRTSRIFEEGRPRMYGKSMEHHSLGAALEMFNMTWNPETGRGQLLKGMGTS